MTVIEQKLSSWSSADQAVGTKVHDILERHLAVILLKAYKAADPSMTALPAEILNNERRKFGFIAKGNFSREYFQQQEVITGDLARRVDYIDYFAHGYAQYATQLLVHLVRETSRFTKDREQLLASLVRSVFADLTVAMSHYATSWSDQAERARRERDAEQARMAAEDEATIRLLGEGLAALARGDLAYRITATIPPKAEALKRDFNDAITHLEQALSQVAGTADSLHGGLGEISTGAGDLSRRTEQQAASLEETAAALDQITATVRRSAEAADHARTVVGAAKADAERSSQVVGHAVEAMRKIEESSMQITSIIGVIDEIAFQTNLLALNAGVEAARAGEAGRGFAVVASEVRALAQRSADAAKQIKGLITASSDQVGHGVDFVGQTGKGLDRMLQQIKDVDVIVGEIASSTKEQSVGLSEVNTAVNQMDQITQKNAAMVEQSTAASHDLVRQADTLSRLIGGFRMSGAAAPERRPSPKAVPLTGRAAARTSAVGAAGLARQVAAAAPDQWDEF